ncbi:hypothetical protein [Nonomuraea typhae]|uniref:Core-binding (CB) domain-containing protein n=1 Tax=Nonomuraea typhae TaxID=2603600 RepID=A0ABW7YYE6_9ACTN
MTIAIPKPLRSLEFTELTLVELNDVDIDRMLPHLWELIVKQGHYASTTTAVKAAERYDAYLSSLAASERLEGFDSERGREVLDGWLRSSVVRIGGKGRGRSSAQMDYVLPLTIAGYRSGLPSSRSRHRHADTLIYNLMIEELMLRGVESPKANLRERFSEAVGQGVLIGPPGSWAATYDGESKIDINALLSLYFLDEFDPPGSRYKVKEYRGSAVPHATRGLGADLIDYVRAYGGRLTPSAFIDRLAALISLRLFQLPLRIAPAAKHVLVTGGPTPDMRTDDSVANPLELYCDFTQIRGSSSDELARRCVQRDLDALRSFVSTRLLARSLREAMAMLRPEGQQILAMAMPDSLIAMAEKKEDPLVSAHATVAMRSIEDETKRSDSGTDEDVKYINSIMTSEVLTPIEQLTNILEEGLGAKASDNQIRWFWSTGGILKPYGLLAGDTRSRRSWRYAPSDDLLFALLLVCFTTANGARRRAAIPIAELLQILKNRFGILIDRPPSAFTSADNRAAATANLEAFKRRLQLLGCFDGLSDDFSAQFVRHPLQEAT